MEISPIYHNSRPEGKLPAQEAAAFDFLDSLGIDYERVTHELADTMEKCDDVSAVLGVDVCKNLFLCNRQKTNFYLLCMPPHKAFHTKDLSCMAHPLGAIFDIPHGVANALLLPVIMEFNAPAALSKYVDIAKAMNVYKDGMSREEAAKAAVEAVKALSVKVGIPQHLSELGIKEEDLPRLAASAIADVCTPGNPREVTEEIILELYKKAF